MMRKKTFLLVAVMLAVTSSVSFIVTAQSTNTITRFVPTAGTINAETLSQSWSFNALANEVISLHVEASDATLDPILELVDSDGQIVIRNDDYDYPNSRDSLLEAITLPRTGTYQAVVRGYNDTTGNYTITLSEGYTDINLQDNFEGDSNWVATNNDIEINTANGGLVLSSEGVQISGFAYNVGASTVDTFYAQVDVVEISSREGWTAGLAIRASTSRYYLFTVNARGQWRSIAVEGDEQRTLRDFIPHPAIVPGETNFTFGVLAHQSGFDVFYNRQLIGQVIDDGITASGQVGIFIETANAVGAQMSATFDNLYVTTPQMIDNNTVFPQQIILGSPAQVTQELERRLVIPSGGILRFDVDESFIDSTRPGVLLQPLASGSIFTNLVIGTTVNIVQNTGENLAGCGIIVRYVDDSDYLVAYIDTDSAFGVSQRSGDQFTEGIFAENPDLLAPELNTITLILLDTSLYFFVNGQAGGEMTISPQAGGVGNALINFEAVNTTCQFSDTWLWSLDE